MVYVLNIRFKTVLWSFILWLLAKSISINFMDLYQWVLHCETKHSLIQAQETSSNCHIFLIAPKLFDTHIVHYLSEKRCMDQYTWIIPVSQEILGNINIKLTMSNDIPYSIIGYGTQLQSDQHLTTGKISTNLFYRYPMRWSILNNKTEVFETRYVLNYIPIHSKQNFKKLDNWVNKETNII